MVAYLIAVIAALAVIAGLQIVLLLRKPGGGDGEAAKKLDYLKEAQSSFEQRVAREIAAFREENKQSDAAQRKEIGEGIRAFQDSTVKRLAEIAQANDQRMENLRKAVDENLKTIREASEKKLDEMRKTVDERLEKTLETRLGESFKQVSERLEQVHKGLGEMQTLAQGVGDLKKILSNVKTRGVFGEAQLEALLEEILTPDQYGTNVATIPGSNERVEFAVRLPGRDGTSESAVLLPIDAKFPMDKYQHLVAAYENGDADAVDKARNDLSATVQGMAKDIREKYVEPPHTTDFGIMFLATESLYAEVLRTPGLFEFIRAKHHVVIAGPTTLAAVLNSLQMGFRTLAIEKRSSEVWKLLGAIKTEFGKFGEILDATDRQIQTVSNSIRRAKGKTTTITRKLRDVETLPVGEAGALLPEEVVGEADEFEDTE